MTAAYLYLKWRGIDETQMSAYKEVNGQLFQIGDKFGAMLPSTFTGQWNENSIALWNNKIYAMDRTAVWEYDVSTNGPWQSGHILSDRNVSATQIESQRMGFTPCSINGSGVLVTAYCAIGGTNKNFRVVKIDLDGNITEGPSTLLVSHVGFSSANQNKFASAGSYRNSVFFMDAGSIVDYNLETDTITEADAGTTNCIGSACVFRDKIFFSRANGSNRYIYRKDGSTATLIWTSGVDGTCQISAKNLLMTHEDSLLYLYCVPFTPAPLTIVETIKLDFAPGAISSPVASDITSEVWGTQWRDSVLSDANETRNARFHVQESIDEGGPSNPAYRISTTRTETAGGPNPLGFSEQENQMLWSFVPPTGRLQIVGAGMNSYGFSYLNIQQGTGGVYQWAGSGTLSAGAPRVSLATSNNQVNCVFKVYGPNVSDVAMQTLYDKEGRYTLSEATISATSLGSLSGNIVTGITATPGGTEVTVLWEAIDDGIGVPNNPPVAARVFRP